MPLEPVVTESGGGLKGGTPNTGPNGDSSFSGRQPAAASVAAKGVQAVPVVLDTV